jgi:hypothetical protein
MAMNFRPKNIAATGATFACAFTLCGLFHNELLELLGIILPLLCIAWLASISVLIFSLCSILAIAMSGIVLCYLFTPVLLVFFLIRDHRCLIR